ncbi:MAG: DNA-binding protein [bacterium]|nr:DNA-binding protein [bacterium]
MKVHEKKFGRIYQLVFERGDDFFGELNRFVKEKNIRAGSVFIFGALAETDMVTGFKSNEGFDIDPRAFKEKQELLGLGNISWPDAPPRVMGDVVWDEPQPYVHIHLAISGTPGKTEEVLVGHLSGGKVVGMYVDIYELV